MLACNTHYASPVPPPAPMPEAVWNRVLDLMHNAYTTRMDWLRKFLDPRRSIEDECGYPAAGASIDAYLYQQLYDRDPIACRVVELLPEECWQVQPLIYETEDADTVTPFEEAVDALGRDLCGAGYYREEASSPLWDYLCRADIDAGIGHFGLLLLGLDDGLPLNSPVKGFSEEGSLAAGYEGEGDARRAVTPSYNGHKPPRYRLTVNAKKTTGRRLLYLRTFPESQVQITRFEANPASPRYGQPVLYTLTLNDPASYGSNAVGLPQSTVNVHWTRVIHISDREVFGTPRMRPVLNRLMDLQKVYGADGEGYWLSAFADIFFTTQPVPGGNPGDVDIDTEGLRDMMEKMKSGLQRWGGLRGLEPKSLPPSLTDPTAHVAVHLEAICIKLGCPVPVFKGYEIGEQASTENRSQWDKRVRKRRRAFATARLIIPFFDRLIQAGVLPEPTDGYRIEWPDDPVQSAKEKADILVQRTQALTAYVSGGADALMAPMDYLTREMGYTEEEAETILDNATEAQEEKLAERAEQMEAGLVPTPPGMGDVPAGEPEEEGEAVGEKAERNGEVEEVEA